MTLAEPVAKDDIESWLAAWNEIAKTNNTMHALNPAVQSVTLSLLAEIDRLNERLCPICMKRYGPSLPQPDPSNA